MSADQWIGLAIALAIMVVGLAGSVLPGLPSTPIVLAAAIAHRLYFGEASVSNVVLALLVLAALLALVLDYLASMVGAKKMGATWRGVAGAIVGAVVGLFFGPIGILLGPFLGALAFEFVGGREFSDATRAGVGALIGLVLGSVGKLAVCAAMMALFAANVIARSNTP